MHRTQKALTPAQHDLRVRRQFPTFRFSHSARGVLWRGDLQPQSDGPIYRVRVDWRGRKQPRVFVESPMIQARAPHRYGNGSLCLYFPRDESWTPQIHIANSILPWTAEWLLFYEIWLVTKKWYGPEAPHGRGPKR